MQFELRDWQPQYAQSLAESANDVRITRFLRDSFPSPYLYQDAAAYIAFAKEEEKRGGLYRAIASEGRVIGGLSLSRGSDVYCKSGELGYWLSPAYWGKGIMTRALKLFCGQVFSETDIVRIGAEVFAGNAASCRVLEKCGFQKEGMMRKSVYKNGLFDDAVLYALVRE